MQNDQKFNTPDSCYSWAIATACNIMYFLIYGMIRVSGALFAEIVTSYNIDRQLASLPFVLSSSVSSFLGPVVGCLIEAMGFRPVFLMGSIFSVLGIGGCFFASTIAMICVFWGLIYGIGDALITSALPQLIYLYFDKHVSTATGFAITGAPIAGFVLSPITDIILKTYGLSGSFLMLSGILLHTLPVAMFLKEPNYKPWHLNTFCIKPKNEKAKKINADSDIPPSGYVSRNENIPPHSKALCQTNIQSHEENNKISVENNLNNMEEISSIPNSFQLSKRITDATHIQTAPITNGKKTTTWFHVFKIFWHPVFLVISVSRCLHMLSFIIIPTLMVDFYKDKGFNSSTSSYILMSLYGADLFGKVVFGWVTDRGYMTIAGFTSLCYFMTAVSFATIAWPSAFSTVVTAAVFLGMCVGAISALSPRLVSEYIEPDNQIAAMTSGDIFVGAIGFLVPLLIGYFRDNLGSYDWLMYIMSIVLSVNAVMLLFLPKLAKWKMSRNKSLT